jgi:glycosyltransferase involved in cell wall biosynthesis
LATCGNTPVDDGMRICIVCTGFCSVYGGLESVYKELGEKWVEKGHEVFAISGFGSLPYIGKIRIVKVPFISRKFFERVQSMVGLSRFESSELEGLSCEHFVARVLAVLKPDIVLSNTKHETSVPLRMGYPCVMVSEAFIRSRLSLFGAADRVIVNDEESLHQLLGLGIKAQLIMNGVALSPVSKMDVDELRAKYSVPKNSLVILTVARLYPRKRINLLIQAFNLIKKPSVLLIVGDGPEISFLKKLASGQGNRIVFLKKVPQENLRELYELCDVFTLPSSAEGLPLTLLEALAYGKPVVANPAQEKKFVLGKFGLFVNVEDPVEYSKSLIAAAVTEIDVQSKEYREHMRQFDWDNITLQYLETFDEILKDRRRNSKRESNIVVS